MSRVGVVGYLADAGIYTTEGGMVHGMGGSDSRNKRTILRVVAHLGDSIHKYNLPIVGYRTPAVGAVVPGLGRAAGGGACELKKLQLTTGLFLGRKNRQMATGGGGGSSVHRPFGFSSGSVTSASASSTIVSSCEEVTSFRVGVVVLVNYPAGGGSGRGRAGKSG